MISPPHPNPPAQGEILPLTSIRGFLATWVVLYHYWNDIVRLFPSATILDPLVLRGHLAVPAFFILSGLVLAHNYGQRMAVFSWKSTYTFLLLRLFRIYPVHLVTLLVVLAMVLVSRHLGYQLTDAGYSWDYFVRNLLLMQTWVPHFELNWNYPSWSISSEWFAYLLFPFAVPLLLRHLTTVWRAALFGLAALAGSVAMMTYWHPQAFAEMLLVVPTFFAGASVAYLCRQLRPGTFQHWRYAPDILTLAAIATCFIPSIAGGVALLMAIFFLMVVIFYSVGNRCSMLWTGSATVFLGEVSYSLYMTHTLAQKLIVRLLPAKKFADASVPTKAGVLAVYAALILTLCLGCYYLLENPARQALKNLMKRRAPATPTPAPVPVAQVSQQ